MWSIHYSCQILIKLEFFLQIFEHLSNIIKIHPLGAMLLCANTHFANVCKNVLRILVDAIHYWWQRLGIVFPLLGSPVPELCMWHTHQQKCVTWSSSCSQWMELHNLKILTHSDGYFGIYFFLNLHLHSYGCSTNTMLQKPAQSLAE